MEPMIGEISNFYKIVAPMNVTVGPNGNTQTISRLSRFDFLSGACLAFLYLIQKVYLSFFYLIGTIATCFCSEDIRNSLFLNLKNISICLGAISLGLLGTITPETINEKILQIPPNGLTTQFKIQQVPSFF